MTRAVAVAAAGSLFAALAAVGAVIAKSPATVPLRDPWTVEERALLEAMRLPERPHLPGDPSNAVEANGAAVALGRALFEDRGLSSNGRVSCASCHLPERGFQDDRSVGRGVGVGARRTMPVMGAHGSPFLFWDGRKDSLWSQALGPLEDPNEHGTTRTQVAQHVLATYRRDYETVFGAAPDLSALPAEASPKGSAAATENWHRLTERQRDAVNRVFANAGKAIAAYERTLAYGPSRLDRYIDATLRGDGAGQAILSPAEVRGLKVFLGRGQCATCHSGPMLSDHAFHNTGVPPATGKAPDRGRFDAIAAVQRDEFNCLGRYSDARPDQCDELRFVSEADDSLLGAFRTPSLRNVAERAPYMHAGQLATLEAVLEHYAKSPPARLGHSELARPGERHAERNPIVLSADDRKDLLAFLHALSTLPAAKSAEGVLRPAGAGAQGPAHVHR